MYLLITAAAAILATVGYCVLPRSRRETILSLCLFLWGATAMWTVDLCVAAVQEGTGAFEISENAVWIGALSVLLALVLWGVERLVCQVGRMHRKQRLHT